MFSQDCTTHTSMKPALSEEFELKFLTDKAIAYGASDAAVIDAGNIRINERLAAICRQPGCPFYGKSASCPPNVEGPEAFQQMLRKCTRAVIVRIDVPLDVLYSADHREVMAFLHGLVATVETLARSSGYARSRAFAGGSCKDLFCSSHANCQYLQNGICRNPDSARPSMSGFGIDVGHLMTLASWHDKKLVQQDDKGQKISWIAGLILIG